MTTARLHLSRFQPGDLEGLAEVFAHPEVWMYPYGRALSQEETQAFLDAQIGHWDDRGFGCWVARRTSDDRIIGYVGISVPTFLPEILPAVEVGWRLTPSAWGRGYATEGATAALDQAFTTLGLATVCSVMEADNSSSAAVAHRLGMRPIRQVTIPSNERRGALEALLFEIRADEWLGRPR